MKVPPPSDVAVAAARRALAAADVRRPSDIQVEAIAARLGVMIVYERLTTAEALLLHAGGRAVICIDEALRGTPRAYFAIAHELGHRALHSAIDHLAQCSAAAEARTDRAWRVETEADQFAAELLMPEALCAPFCTAAAPAFDDVERVARAFGTSFVASGIRYVELARAPCAITLLRWGRVAWAAESPFFPGMISARKRAHAASVAARLLDRSAGWTEGPVEVPGEAWGAREPLVEQAVSLGRGAGVLSWVRAVE
ncbi:MAG TPA: ImmA/IrrE family metallo-endopeptidase [Polyangiaceae bacterium]|jgi:Zn-dependent peptidase ImmA (M78 family)